MRVFNNQKKELVLAIASISAAILIFFGITSRLGVYRCNNSEMENVHSLFNEKIIDYYCKKGRVGEIEIGDSLVWKVLISGIITDRYQDRCENMDRLLLIQNDDAIIPINTDKYFRDGARFYKDVRIGDSLFKKRNSLIFSVVRKGLIKNYYLGYPMTNDSNPWYKENCETLTSY